MKIFFPAAVEPFMGKDFPTAKNRQVMITLGLMRWIVGRFGWRGVMSLVVFLFVPGVSVAYGDSDVVIVIPAGENRQIVQTTEFELVLEVSAFSPIKRIRINGEEVAFTPGDWVEIRQRRKLTPGENLFRVEAESDQGWAVQEFRVFQGDKEAATSSQSPFQFTAQLAVERVRNPNQTDIHTPANRGQLMVVTGYDWAIGNNDNNKVRLKAALATDQYGDETLHHKNSQFTALTADWVRGITPTGQLVVGLTRENASLTKADTPQGGDGSSIRDLVRLGWQQQPAKRLGYGLALEIGSYDVDTTTSDPARDGSAQQTALLGNFRGDIWGALWANADGRITDHDAQGDLNDHAQQELALTLGLPIGAMVYEAGGSTRRKEYDLTDPIYGLRPGAQRTAYHATARALLSKSWVASLTGSRETQQSNLAEWAYENTTLRASVTYIH